MYLVAMDQVAREDIAAAAAAHHELGSDYDGAVAEGLIERIGAEIDKRVDARLGQRDDKPVEHRRDSQPSPAARTSWSMVVLALGSMGLGIGATGTILGNNNGAGYVVVLIWIIIGIINVSYARRR
jgi:hypothetical protein